MSESKHKSEQSPNLNEKGVLRGYDPTKPFNTQIRELIKSTHPKEGPITVSPFGKRFKVEKDTLDWNNFFELTGTDGIGTKGALHWKMGTVQNGVQDVFAMVVDDLIEGNFRPVLLQDHILIQEEDQSRIFAIINKLVELSKIHTWKYGEMLNQPNPIIITGGETAIINTIDGFEMGITATGYVRKGCEIYSDAKEGDVIIGLGSSGVHSNGLTFLRDELFNKRKMTLEHALPWGTSVGEELTKSTEVYLSGISDMINYLTLRLHEPANKHIHGMVHITGGGLSKLKELIPNKDVDIEVRRGRKLPPQPIFRYVHDELGVSSDKMYTRFNNGIGYVIALDQSVRKEALAVLGKRFKADEIGEVTKGTGRVLIESEYDPMTIKYRA